MFKVQQHDPKPLSWWYARKDQIEFDPVYQRKGRIWNDNDRSYLIDSILNTFDVPKFYVADFTFLRSELNVSQKQYAIVDGKQRLSAIFDFFEGLVVLPNDFVFLKRPELNLGGLSIKDLKANFPDIAEDFSTYMITVMSIITDEESTINEMFVRLNRSKPLTGAEVRNAMQGIVPVLIRDLASHEFFTKNVRFKIDRGGDKNLAAKLLLLEFRSRFVDTKKTSLDRFVDEGVSAENPSFEQASVRARVVLDRMHEVFMSKDDLLKKAGPVPLYYWLIRSVQEEDLYKVRPFLVSFEKERESVRSKMSSNYGEGLPSDLVNFNVLNRSSDDPASYVRRYEIIWNRYTMFDLPYLGNKVSF